MNFANVVLMACLGVMSSSVSCAADVTIPTTSGSSTMQAEVSSAVNLVAALYRKFAWEAVMTQPRAGAVFFIDESPRQLNQYLVPSLTQLLRSDRECAVREGVCRLDFSPLWAAQDPAAMELRVLTTEDPRRVKVQFMHPGAKQTVVLFYQLEDTAAGPRITDIEYGDSASLRHILQSPN